MYHPAIEKIVTSKSAQWALWVYTSFTFTYLASFPILNLIHFLFFDQRLYDVIMNLMIMSSGLHAAARVAWFVMRQSQFGKLFELWDVYFGTDSDAIEREVINKWNINKTTHVQKCCQTYFQAHYKRFKKRMYYYSAMAALALNPWIFAQYFESDKTMKVPTPIPYRHESPYYEYLVTFYVYPCVIHTFA